MRLFCFFFHRETTDERWLWTPRSNSFHQKNGAVQLWLDKNRLPASGTLKSTVVRIWYWTPSGCLRSVCVSGSY